VVVGRSVIKRAKERKRESHARKGEKQENSVVREERVYVTNRGRACFPHQTTSFTWQSQNPKHAKNFSCSTGLFSCIVACICLCLSVSLLRSQNQSPFTCYPIHTGYRSTFRKKSRETYSDKPCVTSEQVPYNFF
jgi:hypothetical protein